MTSQLAILCEQCLSLAVEGPCDCGKVATRQVKNPYNALAVFCDTHDGLVLVKVWLDDAGIISFFRRYKDIKIGKIVPISIKKEEKHAIS